MPYAPAIVDDVSAAMRRLATERSSAHERARFRKARENRKDGEALHADPLQHGRPASAARAARATSSTRSRAASGGAARGCGHTFNPFAGRYLNNVKLSANEWLWVVKLFELETSATVIASETGISYPTALKAIDTIRSAIAEARCSDDGVPGDCEATDRLQLLGAPNGNGASGDAEPVADDTILHHLKLGNDCLILTERSPGIQLSHLPGAEDRGRRSRQEASRSSGSTAARRVSGRSRRNGSSSTTAFRSTSSPATWKR